MQTLWLTLRRMQEDSRSGILEANRSEISEEEAAESRDCRPRQSSSSAPLFSPMLRPLKLPKPLSQPCRRPHPKLWARQQESDPSAMSTSTAQPQPAKSSFKMEQQKADQWCWAAVGVSVNNYIAPHSTLTQSQLAGKVLT